MKWYKTNGETLATCKKIADARLHAGISQAEAADKVGTHQTYISKIDNGRVPTVMGESLFSAFKAYGALVGIAVPALEEVTGRARMVSGKGRTARRSGAEKVSTHVPNEAAQLGVLNLVAQGTLKPDAALTLLKTL